MSIQIQIQSQTLPFPLPPSRFPSVAPSYRSLAMCWAGPQLSAPHKPFIPFRSMAVPAYSSPWGKGRGKTTARISWAADQSNATGCLGEEASNFAELQLSLSLSLSFFLLQFSSFSLVLRCYSQLALIVEFLRLYLVTYLVGFGKQSATSRSFKAKSVARSRNLVQRNLTTR